MPTITVELTEYELGKLEALAKRKGENEKGHKGTVQECIKRFAQTCQPDGDGWRHPASKVEPEIYNANHQNETDPKG